MTKPYSEPSYRSCVPTNGGYPQTLRVRSESGLDEAAAGTAEPAPVADGARGHLRAVVHPAELGCAAAFTDDLVEHSHGVIGVDRTGDADRECLAGVLVNDVQQF